MTFLTGVLILSHDESLDPDEALEFLTRLDIVGAATVSETDEGETAITCAFNSTDEDEIEDALQDLPGDIDAVEWHEGYELTPSLEGESAEDAMSRVAAKYEEEFQDVSDTHSEDAEELS